MRAQFGQRRRHAALRAAAGRLGSGRFGQFHHGGVHAGFKHFGRVRQPAIGAVVRQIRAIAADARRDRFPRFRMRPDGARQVEQLDRPLDILRPGDAHILGDGGPRRLFALTALHEPPKTARPHADRLACHRIIAQFLRAIVRPAIAGKRPRVFAFRIVGAGHERPEPAGLQAQPPRPALRAYARIDPVALVRKQERRQIFVQRGGHVRRPLLHDLGGFRLEIRPERPQQFQVAGIAGRHIIQLAFQARGEIILHIAREEPLQERRDQPALFLGEEAILLHPHIGPVAQGLQGAGIGGWPPDAELLQLLHQRRF